MREIIDLTALDGIEDSTFIKPARLVLPNPRRGGPSLLEVRKALAGKGRVRLSATAARVFVDVDPGEPEPLLVALETIARDDAAGLERMLLSVLPHVDEIVLGIDSRSRPETKDVARAYADVVFEFGAEDLGLAPEAWAENRIDFAKARNLGRSRVRSPWTFVLDTDEYLDVSGVDIRKLLRETPSTVGGYEPKVIIGGAVFDDPQRLALTRYRWERGTHNELIRDLPTKKVDFKIVSDTSLRTLEEQSRRDTQRDQGIEELIESAGRGDLNSLFHLAKHRTYGSPEEFAAAVTMVEDYRSRIEPCGVLADERAWLALGVSLRYYQEDDLLEAQRWACRALLDGPSCVAFCVLGDIAEDMGNLQSAYDWYAAACNVEDRSKIKWPGITELRYNRFAGIKIALEDPAFVPAADDDVSAATESGVQTESGHERERAGEGVGADG